MPSFRQTWPAVLTIPVFLVYHLGIVSFRSRNGADLFTDLLLALLDYSRLWYGFTIVGFAVILVVVARLLRSRARVPIRRWRWIFVESAVLAVVLPLVAVSITRALLGDASLSLSTSAIQGLVHCAGAGFHEELLFRVILFGGLCGLLKLRKRSTAFAVLAGATGHTSEQRCLRRNDGLLRPDPARATDGHAWRSSMHSTRIHAEASSPGYRGPHHTNARRAGLRRRPRTYAARDDADPLVVGVRGSLLGARGLHSQCDLRARRGRARALRSDSLGDP